MGAAAPTPTNLQQYVLIVHHFGTFKIETFHKGVRHVLEGRLDTLNITFESENANFILICDLK